MTEPIWIAAIGSFGIIVAAFLTYLNVKRSASSSRVTHLEQRLDKSDLVNRGMWIWNIGLQAQIQNREPPPPLAPPEWLKDLLDK